MATYMRGRLVFSARKRAREDGREFSLMVAFAKDSYPSDNLRPVCNAEMTWNRGGKVATSSSPSFDRIDNMSGYTWLNTHIGVPRLQQA